MAGVGIRTGGLVFVNRDEAIKNGDIVVVLANGDEAIIRRYYRYDNKVILRPESLTEREAEYNARTIRILGKVKHVLFSIE
jgi:repressor LexA